jgi:sugar lactone lactonase YvrE
MKYILLILPLLYAQLAIADDSGLMLQQGWQEHMITECADDMPDMLLLSKDKQYLYQSCETKSNMMSPSLARIHIATGKREILLYGLSRADGMRFAPDGSIWLGEEQPKGMIWHIKHPDKLQAGQQVDRVRLKSSSKQVQAVLSAGIFSHEGLTFSQDGKYLYLADEWAKGCLYRLTLKNNVLAVFHAKKGWLTIKNPKEARLEAEKLHGRWYKRMEDMELMPDGSILIAETGTGNILKLDDSGDKPSVTTFLQHDAIEHPDNLEWDNKRGWLWISDDSIRSELWAWDGQKFQRIAYHDTAEITGLESDNGTIYFNLQHRRFAPDLTLKIFQ